MSSLSKKEHNKSLEELIEESNLKRKVLEKIIDKSTTNTQNKFKKL